jgi:hydrogenase maturation protein HypF
MNQETVVRLRVTVAGTVQGVGFRPFACRLARSLALAGWVGNTPSGAILEIEGPSDRIETFMRRLRTDGPAAARIDDLTTQALAPRHECAFSIRTSDDEGAKRLTIPPDLALCEDCVHELFDPADRRFRYPFMTCAHCGPRFSLVTGIPYDRANTTMSRFQLCRDCRMEYEDHTNRRFHAEPIACPDCGPSLALWDAEGRPAQTHQAALDQACAMIRQGGIVAVKGVGGFLLLADAGSEPAVRALRERKRRPHKPFAVMFPSLDAVRASCELSEDERRWLTSPRMPIVLLRRKGAGGIAESVAPGNPAIGALLPYAPLYHLVMEELQRPLVATSGNRSEEPIVFDEQEAVRRLGGIADAFLVHDRPIARPVDDSVVRVAGSQPIVLRRARGFVPQTIRLNGSATGRAEGPILAVGGHLKNTVALLDGDRVLVSQHLGDLGTAESDAAFRSAIEDLQRLLAAKPRLVACDRHPDYRSTQHAKALAEFLGVPLAPVQHHHAHVAACMAEHGLDGEVLGIAWDGAGYGMDGTIWGGEFLRAGYGSFRRVAHLRPFRLPGGEQAAREPRRCALAALWEALGEDAVNTAPGFDCPEQAMDVAALLRKQIRSPVTTSMGRLFDAVASLLGLCQVSSFEGQAATAVEFAATEESAADMRETVYPLSLDDSGDTEAALIADWRPMLLAMQEDLRTGVAPARIAFRFHGTLADLIGRVAMHVGLPRVVLTGGCFQNGLLAELARERLERAGFRVFAHRELPPNDGGLSLGQAVVAANGFGEE